MITVRHIADGIKVAFSKFSDDFNMPTKWVEDQVIAARMAVLRDEIRKNRFIQQGFYTLVTDLTIEKDQLGQIADPGVSVLGGYRVQIKGLWEASGDPVRYIGKYIGSLNSDDTIEKTSPITIVSFQGFVTKRHSFITDKMQVATVVDDYVYLDSNLQEGEKLLALCLLSDPREMYGSKADISVPEDFITQINIMVKKDIASVFGLLYDPQNDSMRPVPETKSNEQSR